MNFAPSFWFTLCLGTAFFPVHAQVVQQGKEPGTTAFAESTHASPLKKLSVGLSQSVRSWDASLVVLGAFDLYRSQCEGGVTPFAPFGIDRELTESIGRTDRGESLGSRLSSAKAQQAILAGQFLVTTLLDITDKAEVTSKDYERTFVFAKAMLYTYALTELAKNLVARERPDGSDDRSFFSGHASGAFVTSAFLSREIDDWIDGMDFARESATARTLVKATAFTITYGWATYVAYSRIYDQKHYLSDVIVGAIVGTTLAHLLYGTLGGGLNGSDATGLQLNLMPAPALMVGVVYRF